MIAVRRIISAAARPPSCEWISKWRVKGWADILLAVDGVPGAVVGLTPAVSGPIDPSSARKPRILAAANRFSIRSKENKRYNHIGPAFRRNR